MTELNSVLLEGAIQARDEDGDRLFIKVLSRRFSSLGELAETVVRVCAIGTSWNKDLQVGRLLRIVGRLANVDGSLILIAEHIELKPSTKGE